jgi:hypothetical protein
MIGFLFLGEQILSLIGIDVNSFAGSSRCRFPVGETHALFEPIHGSFPQGAFANDARDAKRGSQCILSSGLARNISATCSKLLYAHY